MDKNILSALKYINVAEVDRATWISVGMALKEEGFPCSIWDDWSQRDPRYHPGECEKKWAGFSGTATPVKGGTIVQIAKERGWTPCAEGAMAWDDTIEYDGNDGFNGFSPPDAWNPVQDLIDYLSLLFDPADRVGYVTGDVWQDGDGKWLPSKGVYDRAAGELIASLKKHADDIGASVGDWKPEVGGWIRFNPLDGEGVKNENVTKFKYALVESDTLPIAEQDVLFRKLELPIAALVHSGGKSLHAMLVPLAAVKQYLRIDGDEEDDLLMHFTETAEQICTALLRVKKLSKVEDQAIVRVAILYAVSYLYEHREEADHRGLALTLRSLLFGVRKEAF